MSLLDAQLSAAEVAGVGAEVGAELVALAYLLTVKGEGLVCYCSVCPKARWMH